MVKKTLLKKIEIDQIINELSKIEADTLLIVADHNVWSVYSKEIKIDEIQNKKVILWKSPDGEKAKNITEFQNAIEFFLEKGIHRKAHKARQSARRAARHPAKRKQITQLFLVGVGERHPRDINDVIAGVRIAFTPKTSLIAGGDHPDTFVQF